MVMNEAVLRRLPMVCVSYDRLIHQAIRDRLKSLYRAGSPEKKSPLCSQGRTYGPGAKGAVTLTDTSSVEVGGIGQHGAL